MDWVIVVSLTPNYSQNKRNRGVRVEYGGNTYRVFSFFDEGKLIILINGFQKKTKRTPIKEIKLAEKLKRQYFHEKK